MQSFAVIGVFANLKRRNVKFAHFSVRRQMLIQCESDIALFSPLRNKTSLLTRLWSDHTFNSVTTTIATIRPGGASAASQSRPRCPEKDTAKAITGSASARPRLMADHRPSAEPGVKQRALRPMSDVFSSFAAAAAPPTHRPTPWSVLAFLRFSTTLPCTRALLSPNRIPELRAPAPAPSPASTRLILRQAHALATARRQRASTSAPSYSRGLHKKYPRIGLGAEVDVFSAECTLQLDKIDTSWCRLRCAWHTYGWSFVGGGLGQLRSSDAPVSFGLAPAQQPRPRRTLATGSAAGPPSAPPQETSLRQLQQAPTTLVLGDGARIDRPLVQRKRSAGYSRDNARAVESSGASDSGGDGGLASGASGDDMPHVEASERKQVRSQDGASPRSRVSRPFQQHQLRQRLPIQDDVEGPDDWAAACKHEECGDLHDSNEDGSLVPSPDSSQALAGDRSNFDAADTGGNGGGGGSGSGHNVISDDDDIDAALLSVATSFPPLLLTPQPPWLARSSAPSTHAAVATAPDDRVAGPSAQSASPAPAHSGYAAPGLGGGDNTSPALPRHPAALRAVLEAEAAALPLSVSGLLKVAAVPAREERGGGEKGTNRVGKRGAARLVAARKWVTRSTRTAGRKGELGRCAAETVIMDYANGSCVLQPVAPMQ